MEEKSHLNALNADGYIEIKPGQKNAKIGAENTRAAILK